MSSTNSDSAPISQHLGYDNPKDLTFSNLEGVT